MNRIVLIFSLMLLGLTLILTGCGKDNSGSGDEGKEGAKGSVRRIQGEELKTMIDEKKELVILDVREDYEYKEGHLEDSVWIPMGEIQDRFKELDKNKSIVVVCASGARSGQVAQFLVEHGFTDVMNLAGGLSSWPYPDMVVK